MGSSAEAFGIFSCDREDEPAGIGQDSEYGYGLLRFRQGRWFVSILTSGDYETAEEAILELGRVTAALLGPDGPEPVLLALLPDTGRLDSRTSYFHSNVNLNTRYFIASENILLLERDTDCVFAEYEQQGSQSAKLFLIRYPGIEQAEAAEASFMANYLTAGAVAGEEQMEDGGWTRIERRNEVIAVVFDARAVESARELHSQLRWP
jgi:hypothetical protein